MSMAVNRHHDVGLPGDRRWAPPEDWDRPAAEWTPSVLRPSAHQSLEIRICCIFPSSVSATFPLGGDPNDRRRH